MAHPYHTGRPGAAGGSKPAINNNHMAACTDVLKKAQANRASKLGNIKNPVSRLVK